MTYIDVTATTTKNNKNLIITITNDGSGIPIKIHPTENIYIPELIFGHLLTGSNFADSKKRLTGTILIHSMHCVV